MVSEQKLYIPQNDNPAQKIVGYFVGDAGGNGGSGLEARIAKLESDVGHIQRDVGDIKTDIRWLIGGGCLGFIALITALAVGYIRLDDRIESKHTVIDSRLNEIKDSIQQSNGVIIEKLNSLNQDMHSEPQRSNSQK